MIKTSSIIIGCSVGLCLSAWAAEEDAEVKVSLDKVPAAAAKALKEHARGAKITNVSKEKEEGKTVYEATFTVKGRVHDVTVDEKGKLLSDEEVVHSPEAPAAVRTAVEKAAAGGKVEKFERIKEGGKISPYEALISAKGKREEIKYDDKGKVLEREDKTGDKEVD